MRKYLISMVFLFLPLISGVPTAAAQSADEAAVEQAMENLRQWV